MTASVTIINTSNLDEDIAIRVQGLDATLKRGDKFTTAVYSHPSEITAVACLPKDKTYLGGPIVTVELPEENS